jgi:hypothetical protein
MQLKEIQLIKYHNHTHVQHHRQSVVNDTFQKPALTGDDELIEDNESKEAITSIKIT